MSTPRPSSSSAPSLPLSLTTPLVPLLSSSALLPTLAPNHLPNLAALLRPFTHGFAPGSGLSARALNLQTVGLPAFGLRVVDFDEWARAGGGGEAEGREHQQGAGEEDVADALAVALSRLPSAVSLPAAPAAEGQPAEGPSSSAGAPPAEVEDEAWPTLVRLLDASRPEVGWETFGHPTAMIIAIPSTVADPLGELSVLFARSRARERFAARPWMADDVLRFIVVVHDLSSPLGSLDAAQRTLESIKKTYGPHCALLALNSLAPALPPSPFLHETYARQPPTDPVRALLDGQEATTETAVRREVLEEADGPLGEEGIEMGRRLSEAGDDALVGGGASSSASASAGAVDGIASDGTQPAEERLLGGRMTEQDVLAVKVFLKEFAGGSLIPYMERTISAYNEIYNSTRKGITGRLFGAGRKLWGGGDSRPSSPAGLGGVGYNPIRGFYPHQAPEATNRRLADLAFLLRDYKFAATIYDGIRKDYVSDKATLYVAGASEMLGLSLLLSAPTPAAAAAAQLPLVESYFDSALSTFVGSPLPQLASVRMTVAYCGLYASSGAHRPASQALVRAAGEAEEVWAAVLLQRAAEVEGSVEKLGRGGRGRERRQAGNWVEAAKRFEVCGLKSYSTRCLEKALVIYRASTWTQAQFFVEHALGRQAYTMGRADVAVEHFVRLLALAEGQSGGWLDDFELAFKHLATHQPEKVKSLPTELPKALFDTQRTAIRTAHADVAHGRSDPAWAALEADFLRLGSFDGGKRPAALLPEGGNVVSAEEAFHVVLEITNPLDTALKLGQLTVGGTWSDAPGARPEVETIPELVLEPGETRKIPVRIVPSADIRQLAVTSVSYLFHNLFAVRQSLVRRGARLHTTKAQRLTPTYAADSSLTVVVEPKRPVLVLETTALPVSMAQGETRRLALVLRNDGGTPAKAVSLLTGGNGLVRLLGTGSDAGPSKRSVYATSQSSSTFEIPNHLASTAPVDLDLPAGELAPGSQITLDILVHGPLPGALDLLCFLAYRQDGAEQTFASTAAHQIDVVPVLEVFANHRPSAARTGQHLVSLEFTSLSSEPVDVTGVQVLSSAWAATSPTGPTIIPTLTSPGESQRSYLQLAARPSSQAAADMRFTATKLHQLLSGTLDTTTLPPPVEVAATPAASPAQAPAAVDLTSAPLQPLLLAQLSALRRTALTALYPLIAPASLAAVFPLLEPRDIVLVILFRLPSSGAHGHLVIAGLSPGPSESLFLGPLTEQAGHGARVVRNMFEQTDKDKRALAESVLDGPLGREDDPVRVDVIVDLPAGADDDDDVRWDFAADPLALAVSYTITNTSPRLSTRVSFSLLPSPPSTLYGPSLPSGSLSLSQTLGPLSSATLTTSRIVVRPGTFDLEGSWRLAVETGAGAGEGEAAWEGRRSFDRVRKDEGPGRVVGVRAVGPGMRLAAVLGARGDEAAVQGTA